MSRLKVLSKLLKFKVGENYGQQFLLGRGSNRVPRKDPYTCKDPYPRKNFNTWHDFKQERKFVERLRTTSIVSPFVSHVDASKRRESNGRFEEVRANKECACNKQKSKHT